MATQRRTSSPDGLFPRSLWGYSRDSVDAYLARSGEAEPQSSPAGADDGLGRALEGVGEQVDAILAATRESAAKLLAEAELAARQTRQAAEHEAEEVRAEAKRYADQTREAADHESEEVLRRARIDQNRLEQELDELRERRRAVLAQINAMRGSLGTVVGEYEEGTAEFDAMRELQADAEHPDHDEQLDEGEWYEEDGGSEVGEAGSGASDPDPDGDTEVLSERDPALDERAS